MADLRRGEQKKGPLGSESVRCSHFGSEDGRLKVHSLILASSFFPQSSEVIKNRIRLELRFMEYELVTRGKQWALLCLTRVLGTVHW